MYSSRDILFNLSETTSPQKLFPSYSNTLYERPSFYVFPISNNFREESKGRYHCGNQCQVAHT